MSSPIPSPSQQVPMLEQASWLPSIIQPSWQQGGLPEAQQKADQALDPITTLVQLALIETPGTKVQIYDNQLFIQPKGFKQILDRTPLTGLFHSATGWGTPPPSRDDYVVFRSKIIQAVKWYKPHLNEGVKQLFRQAAEGLKILKKTYEKTTTEHSFILCIQLIEQACEGTLKFEKKAKNSALSEPIAIANSSSGSTSTDPLFVGKDFDIQLRSKDIKKRFKTLWDMQQIEDIVKRIGIVREHTKSADLEEKVYAEKTREIIDAIVQMQVKRLQALDKYNNACEFIQTMDPLRRTSSSSSIETLSTTPTQ